MAGAAESASKAMRNTAFIARLLTMICEETDHKSKPAGCSLIAPVSSKTKSTEQKLEQSPSKGASPTQEHSGAQLPARSSPSSLLGTQL